VFQFVDGLSLAVLWFWGCFVCCVR